MDGCYLPLARRFYRQKNTVSSLMLAELVIFAYSPYTSSFHLQAKILLCHFDKFLAANGNTLSLSLAHFARAAEIAE